MLFSSCSYDRFMVPSVVMWSHAMKTLFLTKHRPRIGQGIWVSDVDMVKRQGIKSWHCPYLASQILLNMHSFQAVCPKSFPIHRVPMRHVYGIRSVMTNCTCGIAILDSLPAILISKGINFEQEIASNSFPNDQKNIPIVLHSPLHQAHHQNFLTLAPHVWKI